MTINQTAIDFVLGALSPHEREAVQLERAVNCELDAAIASWEEKLASLTASAGTVRPPDYLFDLIAEQIAHEQAELGTKTVIPLADGDWRPCLAGVEMKPLWSPQTFLLRCQPGATIPQHAHGQIENLVVIMGDLDVGGRILTSGDYHRSPAGSVHGETRTRRGCVLLVQYCA
jgi:ChrR Cupin-like domain